MYSFLGWQVLRSWSWDIKNILQKADAVSDGWLRWQETNRLDYEISQRASGILRNTLSEEPGKRLRRIGDRQIMPDIIESCDSL